MIYEGRDHILHQPSYRPSSFYVEPTIHRDVKAISIMTQVSYSSLNNSSWRIDITFGRIEDFHGADESKY